MDEMKIQNFIAAHPGASPPKFRHLEPQECEVLRVRLCKKLALPADTVGLQILQSIEKRATVIPDARPSEELFRISDLMRRHDIRAQSTYINWYRFDNVDEIDAAELDSAFHDIWYPDSDDIELFDETVEWVVLVRHFDVIQIARF